MEPSPIKDAPVTAGGLLKQLGPGLIISASIVGSGELIVTTKTGAENGFALLWFIIFACLIKVFVQIELGRHVITRGVTMLEAMNSVPGPRLKVSWMVWVWLAMFVATFFQLAGIVGGIASVFRLGGSELSTGIWALIVTGSCAVLLAIGRYAFVERFSTLMVGLFTLFTIFAVFALYRTPYAITAADIAGGLTFDLPENFTVAFAAFGVVGVGASELIYYPYWCLEKGYARYTGPNDGSPEWAERARGWLRVLRWDAWVSMVVYTVATIAFYLLGAAVLHGQGLEIENDNVIPNLSVLYSESFGEAGLWVFIVGAFIVLYSTVFISTASNGRLFADLLKMFGLVKEASAEARQRHIRIACVVLPALYLLFFLLVGAPVTLVTVGAVAQGVMLPLLAIAALYFHRSWTIPALAPKRAWVLMLWLSSALMTLVGLYSVWDQIRKW
ncbi:Nramp family divalent metal transporter [Luteolibacter marinus]|uniref:Nramp family divalent metal transporter n=1 Tax=Luteolibacter marinus TaxID=2776705 RepID=UPI001869560F|nr:Nramp family divalent metal transporter [Luteolibacter marinus]